MSHIKGRLAAILVTAAVAAVGVLFMPASAATIPTLPTGSVDSRVIKDGTIQPRDLSQLTKIYFGQPRANTVTTVQVKNGSIRLEDLDPRLQRLLTQGCGAK
jgi:hypothetical protein